MQVAFNPTQTRVVFLTETAREAKFLAEKFPGLDYPTEQGHRTAPAVLPIVYNLVQRLKTKLKVTVGPMVQAWLDQPFSLAKLPAEFTFHTKPLEFQEIALRYLYTLGSAGLLLDPGMGKSKVTLDYIWLMQFRKAIIVCPFALQSVWIDEIETHRPELKGYILESTDWEAQKDQIAAASVVIMNYRKATLLKHWIIAEKFDFIHLDEFLIKDPTTDQSLTMAALSQRIPYRCGGSGTLINNSSLDVFSPIRYLQPSLVGRHFRTFRERYAIEVERKKKEETDPVRKAIVGYRDTPEVRSILESCCIVMTKDKWLKLPEKRFHEIEVSMGPDQRKAYYDLLQNYYAAVADKEITVDNALVMMSKLFQISQGFLYTYKDDEAFAFNALFAGDKKEKKPKRKVSDREVTFFEYQPKMVALEKLLTETIPSRKSIIWFNLSAELTLIEGVLQKLNANYLVIKGGEPDTGGKVKQFNRTPDITYLVCQAKSVNYGITVLGRKEESLDEEERQAFPGIDPSVYTEVFCSRGFSQEVLLQQFDRIHRIGQTKNCDYYFLSVNSTVERRIREALEDKRAVRESILVDTAKSLLSQLEESNLEL
jgi:SNF2 family DNA or RNA helicase